MTSLTTRVVQHPTMKRVRYAVPEADVPRWEAQGWSVTDGEARVSGQAEEPVPTVAQTSGFGLGTPVDAPAAPAPVSQPTAAEEPTAVDTGYAQVDEGYSE